MIRVSGTTVSPGSINGQWPSGSAGRDIINSMAASGTAHDYGSLDQLKFELKVRTNIIASAKALKGSGATFATFKYSKCNSAFWDRTSAGGFQLRQGTEPSAAIADIFTNGPQYAFECATAMMIVYYKALLESLHPAIFNKLFQGIVLKGWKSDQDLGLTWQKEPDYLPGDRRYFKNPEVNPKTPWWQGENVIDLGDGEYYGHGVGIESASDMIASLNKNRKPGATKSAYLMDKAGRPDFSGLAKYDKYAAWREVKEYQLGWLHDRSSGVVVLLFKDGGGLQIDPLTHADYMSFVDTLRHEEPVYYQQLQNVLTTAKESVGEDES